MRLASLLALLVVLSGCIPGFVAMTGGAAAHQSPALAPPDGAVTAQATATQAEDVPATTVRIALQADGDAEWVVTTRLELETANESRAFESMAAEYEAGDLDGALDAEVFSRAAASANAVTDREMRIENVSRETRMANGTGTLRLEFTWTNFLEQSGPDTLRFDDALRTDGGTWFQSLEPDQRLMIVTPPGYSIDTNPGFPYRNDTVVIDGPMTFGGDRELVLEYQAIQNGGPGEGGPPWDLLVGGGVVLVAFVALVLGVVFLRRREGDATPTGAGTADGDASARPNSDGGTETAPEPGTDPTGPDDAAGASATDEAGEADEAEEEDEVDLGLLSDEERVEYLLEQNGGRMKQASIVKETGWSDAKVSQLLSTMADDGRVDKLRLGRENLISLPDEGDD